MSNRVFLMVVSSLLFLLVPLNSQCYGDLSAQLNDAEQYEDDRQYDQAETSYKAIIAADSNSVEAFAAQEGLAVIYVTMGKQTEADTAYQELLAKYSDRTGIANAVDHVADAYREIRNFQKARQCSQYIVDQWPDADHAPEAQAGVVRASILMGDEIGAQAAMNKLLTSFADSTHVAKAVDDVADDYHKAGQYEIARQWHQYVVDYWPQNEHAIKAQKGVVISNIVPGDQTAAQAAVDKLVTDFSTHAKLPNMLYEIADTYEKAKQFNDAKGIYRRIEQACPNSPQAADSPLDVRKLDIFSLIESGQDNGVISAVDNMTADFTDHPYLSFAVYRIAEYYHERAYRLDNENIAYESNDCFQKAATIFERVIAQFPNADIVPKALRSAGDCYRKVGRHRDSIRCYKKIVDEHPNFETAWNALFMIGRNYEKLRSSGAVAKPQSDSKIKSAYEQLLRDYPSCSGTRYARRWLSRYNSK